MASLLILRGSVPGTRIALEKDRIVLGRDPGCDIVLHTTAASRSHAEIRRREGHFFFRDLDTRGGSYLNNQQVNEPTLLRDGDRIRVCDFVADFESPTPTLTEGWLASSAPELMFSWLRKRGEFRARPLRFLAAACCRRFGLLGPEADDLLGLAERFAEAEPGAAGLTAVGLESRLDLPRTQFHAVWSDDAWRAAFECADAAGRRDGAAEEVCDLIRDLFGNPLHPPLRVAPGVLAWESGLVVRLAAAAYERRSLPSGHLDPARLAVLSDALEEAGCDDASLLEHLRDDKPHVRGCRAIEAVLGRCAIRGSSPGGDSLAAS